MQRTRTVRGLSVPSIFYGTAWKEERTADLTEAAIRLGFRGIDTANQRKHYFEEGVGEGVARALARGDVTRDALFLQTKFTYARGQDHRLPYDPSASPTQQVEQSVRRSLEHLRTTYLDSLVLHGPELARGVSRMDHDVWRAMEHHVGARTVRLLGVSNVSLEQLETLTASAHVKPAFVQNRCYARTGWDRAVRAFCDANDIVYQGFSLLTANARELDVPTVRALCQRHRRTLPEVVMRFALAVGMIPLTGTTSETHMQEDLAAFELELTAEEIDTIARVAG